MIIWRAQSFLGWIVAQTLNRAAACDNALARWLECAHTLTNTLTLFFFSLAQLCSQQLNAHARTHAHMHGLGTKNATFSERYGAAQHMRAHGHGTEAGGGRLGPADKTEREHFKATILADRKTASTNKAPPSTWPPGGRRVARRRHSRRRLSRCVIASKPLRGLETPAASLSIGRSLVFFLFFFFPSREHPHVQSPKKSN